MHRRLILTLLAALALSSCATEAPAVSAPVQASATPTPSATSKAGEDAFLDDVRMKARTLTPELVSDGKLIALGTMACLNPDDEEKQRLYRLDAELNGGFTESEINVAFAAGKRHLC